MKKAKITFIVVLCALFTLTVNIYANDQGESSVIAESRAPATYYINSVDGNDSNDGLSEQNPWKTLNKIKTGNFIPGDTIKIYNKSVFNGADAHLRIKKSGAKGNPITIESYGNGDSRPKLNGLGSRKAVVEIINEEYITIRGLEITNLSPKYNGSFKLNSNNNRSEKLSGVSVIANDTNKITDSKLDGITLENLYIHDINGRLDNKLNGGIIVEAAGKNPISYNDILIQNNIIERVDRSGIKAVVSSWVNQTRILNKVGKRWHPSTNVVIRGNKIDKTGGDGITLLASKNGLMEYNVSRNARYQDTGYNVGIWPFQSMNSVVQYNEAYNTRGTQDGQGFDLDHASANTVMQYNYSHNNEGGFMLMMNWAENTAPTIRYNISQDDKDKTFEFSRGLPSGTSIYNNTIYSSEIINGIFNTRNTKGGTGNKNIYVYNNVFHFPKGQSMYDNRYETKPFKDNIKFDNNLYWGGIQPPKEDTNHYMFDHKIIGIGTGPEENPNMDLEEGKYLRENLKGYIPHSTSELRGKGISTDEIIKKYGGTVKDNREKQPLDIFDEHKRLKPERSIDYIMGNNFPKINNVVYDIDFFGNKLPSKVSIGAVEVSSRAVVNKDYLSDLKEVSAKVGFNDIGKDIASNNTTINLLGEDNTEIDFKKGLGTHAPAEVIYDISGKGYDTFVAKVGVDRNAKIAKEGKAKVKFVVYVDGKKAYDSQEIDVWQPYKDLKIDIKNAKEVKLVVDKLGDAEADHAVWADAMFVNGEEYIDITIDKDIVMEVGEKIDLKNYIYAKDRNGKEVTDITIDDKDLNKDVVGNYNAKATVVNNGIKKDVIIPIEVVAKKAYLSDLQEKDSRVGWGILQKDKAPNGTEINLLKPTGEEVVFKKGLGAHAYSKIVYDIEGKGYEKFLAKVGVDRDYKNKPKDKNTKVSFEVQVDGEKRYDSKEMNVWQPYKDVNVDITGAKEITLITRDLGLNWSDQTVWADAMFTTKENPVNIYADENITLQVGDGINLTNNIYATHKTGHKFEGIEIDTSKIDTSKAGGYIAKVTATNNGKIVTKDIPVKVVERKTYLSDLNEEKGATTGFNGLRKDKASNGSSIDLLRADGEEIVFKKGLGTHAPAEVVYDVAGKGYDAFLAKVGVDRNAKIADKRRANVQFKVFADDTQVYDSSEINVWQVYKEVKVDIPNSTKKIKLVVDGLGNHEADHAVWADAMFTSNIVLPEISKLSLGEPEIVKSTEVIEATDILEADKVDNTKEVTPEVNNSTEEVIPEVNNNTEEVIPEINDNNEETIPNTDNDSKTDTDIGADDTQNNTPSGDNLEQDSNLGSSIETLELLVTN